jgi:hypothetical protein
LGIASLVDTYHVPKLLSQQLLPFGRSGDGLEGLTFEVEQVSALSARRGQSATCVFFASSSSSCSPLSSTRHGFEFSLGKVSDGPCVPGGQSTGAWRTVRVLPADGPLYAVRLWRFCCLFGQSAARVRTVRDTLPDSPHGLCGQSAPPGRTVRQSWQLCFLVRFLPPSFVLPRVLQGIVPKT